MMPLPDLRILPGSIGVGLPVATPVLHSDRAVARSAAQRGTEPMRIGKSQTQRAEDLGVDRMTVQDWDREAVVEAYASTSPPPTHAIDGRGRPQPLHKVQPARQPDQRTSPA